MGTNSGGSYQNEDEYFVKRNFARILTRPVFGL